MSALEPFLQAHVDCHLPVGLSLVRRDIEHDMIAGPKERARWDNAKPT